MTPSSTRNVSRVVLAERMFVDLDRPAREILPLNSECHSPGSAALASATGFTGCDQAGAENREGQRREHGEFHVRSPSALRRGSLSAVSVTGTRRFSMAVVTFRPRKITTANTGENRGHFSDLRIALLVASCFAVSNVLAQSPATPITAAPRRRQLGNAGL